MTTYNIDRNTASRLLNVSVRTIDRYLMQEKLSSVKSDGRVWLSKEEILDFLRGKTDTTARSRQDNRRPHVEADIIVDNSGHMSSMRADNIDNTSRHEQTNAYDQPKRQHELDLDKLYEELKIELGIKDKRLAQASYKIGQLEAQLNSMVPLLEFEQQQKLLAASVEEYESRLVAKDAEIIDIKEEYRGMIAQKDAEKQQLNEIRVEELAQKEDLIQKLDDDLHKERINKWVYAIVLYIFVLAMIILWFVVNGVGGSSGI